MNKSVNCGIISVPCGELRPYQFRLQLHRAVLVTARKEKLFVASRMRRVQLRSGYGLGSTRCVDLRSCGGFGERHVAEMQRLWLCLGSDFDTEPPDPD